ncbi:MAG: SGNH/GDSL hydrolase family protein [Proteobacteria bacterium]|nr:SGNH/GDSL hydrolase family protein [Pseudomonadota bacterium]
MADRNPKAAIRVDRQVGADRAGWGLLGLARRLVILLVVWVIVGAGFCLVVEAGFRLSLPYRAVSSWDYRASRPPAYQAAQYYSAEFIRESRVHQNWINPPNTRVILPGGYAGRWFNVKEGVRRTVGHPPPPSRRLLLVGGSTTYDAEVPDEQTIASHLQSLLNARATGTWSVHNYGASGTSSAQQLERLPILGLKADDIVVFYGGVNDVMQGVFYANFDGWIVGENRKRLDSLINRNRAALEWLGKKSRFFNWLYHRSTDYLPEHLKSPAKISLLAVETRSKTYMALVESDAVVRRAGGTFVHVLQPHLYSGKSRQEAAPLTDNHFLTPQGIELAFRMGYAEMKQLTNDLRRARIRAHDVADAFDAIPQPLFLDWVHVNHRANAEIASRLFDILMADGLVARP